MRLVTPLLLQYPGTLYTDSVQLKLYNARVVQFGSFADLARGNGRGKKTTDLVNPPQSSSRISAHHLTGRLAPAAAGTETRFRY